MAAVQRTPTPVDIRSRKAFIESMEEELKRVQEHLDRRQWRHRNGSISSADLDSKSQLHSRQWYTLARSNPATKKKMIEKEAEETKFVRVSSAQDNVFRTTSVVDSCSSSSSSSKSPTPEPTDVIRAKSPSLSLTTVGMHQEPFSSGCFPPADPSTSVAVPKRQRNTHPTCLYSSSMPQPSPTKPSFDATPLLVKEMPPLSIRPPGLTNARAINSDEEEEDENEEEEEYDSDETSKEVMPSAFGDLYFEDDTTRHGRSSPLDNNKIVKEGESDRNSRSVDDLMQHITPPPVTLATVSSSLHRKDEDDEGIGKSSLAILDSSKLMTDNTLGGSGYDYQRYHDRIQAMKEEKNRTETFRVIEDLKEQLRERDTSLMHMEDRLHIEVKMREERIKKLMKANARSEKEKWELLKKARETAERSVHIRTKLDMNENQLRLTIIELERVNDELSSVKAANKSLRLLVSDLKTKVQLVDGYTQTDESSVSANVKTNTAILNEIGTQTVETGNTFGHANDLSDWEDMLSITSSQYGGGESRDITPINTPRLERGKGRRSMKRLLNRLRRTGSAGNKRNSTSSLRRPAVVDATTSLDNLQLSQSSLISPMNLSRVSSGSTSNASSNRLSSISLHEAPDVNRILDEFKTVPFNQWNTRALVAWMEVVVGMPHYISNVRQHVTSGHAMLALSNSEMEKKLGIPNALHRRRLRLAIEEHRTPSASSGKSCIAEIDHNWVAYTWATECGLPHMSALLYNGMVNGKVLNSLSRDDLKKVLKVTKKTDQLSFLSGVELLRMHDFDRDAIKTHRQASKNPLYWTNNDVCEWLRTTDLEGYADNVISSGVHGALLFLERGNFTTEHLANILRIAPKSAYRRQLATHLAKLFSTEEITSLADESVVEEDPRPKSLSPVRIEGLTSDNSPHPMRRLQMSGHNLPHVSSNPDVSELGNSNFIRQSRDRTSLRESLLRSVNTNPLPPSFQHGHAARRQPLPLSQQKSVTQVCSTTTV